MKIDAANQSRILCSLEDLINITAAHQHLIMATALAHSWTQSSLAQKIDYLKEKQLLNNFTTCNGCGLPMQWKKKADIKDGYTWRCYTCDMHQSIHFGSKSKLELSLYLNLIYHWAIDQPVHTTASQLKLSQKTVIDLFHFLQEVCSKKLCDIDTRLGGPECVVEIDKSLFRAKRKVNK